MKRHLIKGLLLMLILGVVSEISAQKVIVNHPSANGYPVIDLSELAPLRCVLTNAEAAKRRTEINGQNPSNTADLSIGLATSGVTGTWNTKASSQYQVMRADLVPASDWSATYKACRQYSGEGGAAGQWRLPTQRELLMIMALHPQLLNRGGFTPMDNGYLYPSCTESGIWLNEQCAWQISLRLFAVTPRNKEYLTAGRCIRDL